MTTFNTILTLASAVLQLALVVVFLVRKLYGRFKFFFIYVVCSALGDILLASVMRNSQDYYLLYWVAQAIYLLLTILVVLEIVRPALGAVYDEFPWTVFLVPIAVLAVTFWLFWKPIHRIFGSSLLGQVAASISIFQVGVSSLRVLVYLFARWLEKQNVMWEQYAVGVLAGSGFIGLGTLVAYAGRLWLPFGEKAKMIFGYVPSFVFFGALLIWFVIFLEKEKPQAPREPIDREKLLGVLDSLAETFKDANRKVRRFRIRFWWRLSHHRAGMTS